MWWKFQSIASEFENLVGKIHQKTVQMPKALEESNLYKYFLPKVWRLCYLVFSQYFIVKF